MTLYPFLTDITIRCFALYWLKTTGERRVFVDGKTGHIDLPRARKGGFFGGLFAMFTPSRLGTDRELELSPDDPGNFTPVSRANAEPFTRRMIDMALSIESLSKGDIVIAHSVSDVRHAMANGKLAIVLHIEGVECLGPISPILAHSTRPE